MADQPKYGHNKTTKSKKSWDVKESKTGPDLFPSGRVDLNPKDFDDLLLQKGMNVKVYRTMYCPKVKSVDGAEHEIDCNLCNGSGWIDFDPICCKAFIQAQELDKMPQVEGFVDGNTVLISFPVGVELQYFTRIEMMDFTNIYFQRVLRNANSNTDVLQYKACRVNALIDRDGVRYYDTTDFKLNLDGSIMWLSSVQTRTVTFSAVPATGTWKLRVGQIVIGTYTPSTVAATIQTDLRAALPYPALTVTGNYSTGFVISLVGVNGLVGTFYADSDLLVGGSTSVLATMTSALTGGRHPANNVPYSIHYEAPQQFRAAAAGHVNRYTQFKASGSSEVEYIKMPEQWYCAKEFLPKRLDRQGNELQQGPYDNHSIVSEDDNE